MIGFNNCCLLNGNGRSIKSCCKSLVFSVSLSLGRNFASCSESLSLSLTHTPPVARRRLGARLVRRSCCSLTRRPLESFNRSLGRRICSLSFAPCFVFGKHFSRPLEMRHHFKLPALFGARLYVGVSDCGTLLAPAQNWSSVKIL